MVKYVSAMEIYQLIDISLMKSRFFNFSNQRLKRLNQTTLLIIHNKTEMTALTCNILPYPSPRKRHFI